MKTNLQKLKAIWSNNSGNIYQEMYVEMKDNPNILLNWGSGAGKGTLLRSFLISLSPRLDYSILGTSYSELSSKMLLSHKLSDSAKISKVEEYNEKALNIMENVFNLKEIKLKKRSFVSVIYTNDINEHFLIMTFPEDVANQTKLNRYFLKFDNEIDFYSFKENMAHGLNISRKNLNTILEELILESDIKYQHQGSKNQTSKSLFLDSKSEFYSGMNFSDYDKKLILSIGMGGYESVELSAGEMISSKLLKSSKSFFEDTNVKVNLDCLIQDLDLIEDSRQKDSSSLEKVLSKISSEEFDINKKSISLFLKKISEYNSYINKSIDTSEFKENELKDKLNISLDSLKEKESELITSKIEINTINDKMENVNAITTLMSSIGLEDDLNSEDIQNIIESKKEIRSFLIKKTLSIKSLIENSDKSIQSKKDLINKGERSLLNTEGQSKNIERDLISERQRLEAFQSKEETISITENEFNKEILYVYKNFGDLLNLDVQKTSSSIEEEDRVNVSNFISSLDYFIDVKEKINIYWKDHISRLENISEDDIKKNISDYNSDLNDIEIEINNIKNDIKNEKLNLKELINQSNNIVKTKKDLLSYERDILNISNNIEQLVKCDKFIYGMELSIKEYVIELNILLKSENKKVEDLEMGINQLDSSISNLNLSLLSLSQDKDTYIEFNLSKGLSEMFWNINECLDSIEIENHRDIFKELNIEQTKFLEIKKSFENYFSSIVFELTRNGQENWLDIVNSNEMIRDNWNEINIIEGVETLDSLKDTIVKDISENKDRDELTLKSFAENFIELPKIKKNLFGNFKKELKKINDNLNKIKSISGHRLQVLTEVENITTTEILELENAISRIPKFSIEDLEYFDAYGEDWEELLNVDLVKSDVIHDFREVFLKFKEIFKNNSSIKDYIYSNIKEFISIEPIDENGSKAEPSSGNYNSIVSYGRKTIIDSIGELNKNIIIDIPVFYDEISKSDFHDIKQILEISNNNASLFLQQGSVHQEIVNRCKSISSISIDKSNHKSLGYNEDRKIFAISIPSEG